jgi:hypothetical protein
MVRRFCSTLAVAVVALATLVAAGQASAAEPTTAPGGSYHAVTPTRILDTRTGLGAPTGATQSVTVNAAGLGGIPSTGVSAVAVNLTVTGAPSGGYVTAYADGTSRPTVSNVNFPANRSIATMALVPVSPTVKFDLYASAKAQLIADVLGYVTTEQTASTYGLFKSLTPSRLMDTRTGLGGEAPGPKGTTTLQVTGAGGVPAGVTAVVLNVSVTKPTAGGYVTAYPAGIARPTASTLNFATGETRTNRAVVPVGSGGQVSFYNSAGITQLVVDVSGYFTGSGETGGGYYVPVAPTRVLDTRDSSTRPSTWSSSPGSATALSLNADGEPWKSPLAPMIPVPSMRDVAKPTAVWGGLTSVHAAKDSYLTLYGAGTRPATADLNASVSQTRSNSGPVALADDGSARLYSAAGGDALLDLFGYFGEAPASPTPTGVWVTGMDGYDSAFRLVPMTGVKAITGGSYTFALKPDGHVAVWSRPLADGWGVLEQRSPAADIGVDSHDITQLAGTETVYALRSDGTMWAMGDNDFGEFGNGSHGDGFWSWGEGTVVPPTGKVSLQDVVRVGAANQIGYAVTSDGAVWAWGRGNLGQLGNGDAHRDSSEVPVRVSGLSDVRSIAGGNRTSYAVDASGALWRWGNYYNGGPGGVIDLTPQRVDGACATGVAVVASEMGGWEQCADGTVWQLDYRGYTVLNGTNYFHPVPGLDRVAALSSAPGSITGPPGSGLQALRDDGTVWRFDPEGRRFVPVYGLTGIMTIGGGPETGYAVS